MVYQEAKQTIKLVKNECKVKNKISIIQKSNEENAFIRAQITVKHSLKMMNLEISWTKV